MKKIITALLLIAFSTLTVQAQSIGISIGQGVDINTQQISLNYLFTKNRLNFGIGFKAIRYNTQSVFSALQSQRENPVLSNSQKTSNLFAGGVTLNYIIYTTRNFEFEGNLSGYIGGDGHDYIYYPELNFKQNFYLSTNLKFTIGEGINYFFMKNYTAKYNPFLAVGIVYLF